MTDIALYDMDRTITRGATYTPFLIHAAWRHQKWRLLLFPAALASMLAYVIGLVDRAKLKEINHALLLGPKLPAETAARLSESYAGRVLAENVFVQAAAQIAIDRTEGRRLVLATASYAFYVDPIAKRLGFDDVIATRSVRDEDGAILPRIDGENCYAEAKRRMVERWMADQGIDAGGSHIRFYSDSSSDMPVFELSDEPIATNPSSKLRRIAEKAGWKIKAWG